MLSFLKLSGLALFSLFPAVLCRADRSTFASSVTAAAAPIGVSGTVTTDGREGPAYNLRDTAAWATPLSFGPRGCPSGEDLLAIAPCVSSSTLQAWASDSFHDLSHGITEDAATAFPDGHPLLPSNGVSADVRAVVLYSLPQSYLNIGLNTVTFNVQQLNGGVSEPDFTGGPRITPDPGSLVLLGIALVGAASLASVKAARARLLPAVPAR